MEWVLLIGRIFFVMSGINHFVNMGMMAGYAASKGAPAPRAAVAVTGVMLLAGGLSVVFGVLVVIGLILFLVPVAVIMHNFWAVREEQKMVEQVNFMKNVALAQRWRSCTEPPTGRWRSGRRTLANRAG